MQPQYLYCSCFVLSQFKTKRPVRLSARTPGFHPGKRGSIPLRATLYNSIIFKKLWQITSQH
nr:hypothetical protein [uncultured bacterium]